MLEPAAKRAFNLLLIALGLCSACDAEPVEVLTAHDAGKVDDGDATAPPEVADASCSCVAGANVGCLETLDTGDAGCATIFGTKRCQVDGTWTQCLGPVTSGTLQGITCTLINARCGPFAGLASTSGDCTKALRCP